jgi:hypothetical protein
MNVVWEILLAFRIVVVETKTPQNLLGVRCRTEQTSRSETIISEKFVMEAAAPMVLKVLGKILLNK